MINKKFSLTLLTILLISALAGIIYIIAKSLLPFSENSTVGLEENQFALVQTINYGGEMPPAVDTVSVQLGETALAVLQRTHEAQVKEYSFGFLVEGIDGALGGPDGKYWIYYLNGESATVGAGQYQIVPGDALEWRLESGE